MMTASNDFDQDAPQPKLFSARLTPHRSLNRTGFLVLMAFLTAVSFAAGVAFLVMGAWPVFGFFGLDVLVIYWAFRINFRRAAAVEEISVTPSELRVRRISHRGHVVEWVLNPLWVRLDLLPKLPHVYPQILDIGGRSPNLLHDKAMGKHLSRMQNEEAEDVVFLR